MVAFFTVFSDDFAGGSGPCCACIKGALGNKPRSSELFVGKVYPIQFFFRCTGVSLA